MLRHVILWQLKGVAEEAFSDYAENPEHKKVAVEKIRPFVKGKMVLDYLEN